MGLSSVPSVRAAFWTCPAVVLGLRAVLFPALLQQPREQLSLREGGPAGRLTSPTELWSRYLEAVLE